MQKLNLRSPDGKYTRPHDPQRDPRSACGTGRIGQCVGGSDTVVGVGFLVTVGFRDDRR